MFFLGDQIKTGRPASCRLSGVCPQTGRASNRSSSQRSLITCDLCEAKENGASRALLDQLANLPRPPIQRSRHRQALLRRSANGELMSNLSPIQELLVAAAWADGQLVEKEALFLRRVLANGSVSVSQIEACLTAPTVEFGDVLSRLSVGSAGEEVMREVLRMLQSDGALHSKEKDLITRLAQHLKFTQEKVEEIRRELVH